MSFGQPSDSPFASSGFGPASTPPSPFPSTPYSEPPRRRGRNWLLSLFLVLVGFVLLGGAICLAGVWYVASNLDRWLVGLGREAIVAAINDAEIDAQEKTEVIAQVDRVVNAYRERKINQHDLEQALTKLQESPAFVVLSLSGVEDFYFDVDGLAEPERAQGQRALQRVLRGVQEGQIEPDALFGAFPDGGVADVRLASTNSPEDAAADDARELIVKLQVMADNARIPDEPFEIDLSDAVKSIVDEVLAGKAP